MSIVVLVKYLCIHIGSISRKEEYCMDSKQFGAIMGICGVSALCITCMCICVTGLVNTILRVEPAKSKGPIQLAKVVRELRCRQE